MSHDWTLKMKRDWMDVPLMIFTGNPLIIKPGMVFFMHMILMDSDAQLAMNLGETYLKSETLCLYTEKRAPFVISLAYSLLSVLLVICTFVFKQICCHN